MGVGAALALALVGLGAAGPAAAASAEGGLQPVSWSPGPSSVVTTTLSQVQVTFNEPIKLPSQGVALWVSGPNYESQYFETACATLRGRTLSVPVAMGTPGSYRVSYNVVAPNGKLIFNTMNFDYDPPRGTPEAAGNDSLVCSGNHAASADTSNAPGTQAVPLSRGTLAGLGLLAALCVAALVFAGTRLFGGEPKSRPKG
ncbi:MAG TPA: copper resistance protein CopC [Microbacteriaceae bacterium]|nr:copper resistance protein CopC [Microbacteriaceae bacterium]